MTSGHGRGTRGALVVALASGVLACAPVALAASPISEYQSPGNPNNIEIVSGVAGNVWYAEDGGGWGVGFITPSGQITNFNGENGVTGNPDSITVGPDGNMWYAAADGAIGRVTPGGVITEFKTGLPTGSSPQQIVAGPQGKLWFTDTGGARGVGSISTSGTIDPEQVFEFYSPNGMAMAPDGYLYIPEDGHTSSPAISAGINVVDPTGTLGRMVPLVNGGWPGQAGPGVAPGTDPQPPIVAADGRVWFPDKGGTLVGMINSTTSTPGPVYEYGLPGSDAASQMTAGPDGNVWFTDFGSHAIGRITNPAPGADIVHVAPTSTEFPLGPSVLPVSITTGRDGNLWFTYLTPPTSPSAPPPIPGIGRITPTGQVTTFPITPDVSVAGRSTCLGSPCYSAPAQIISGPDGNIYWVEAGFPMGFGRLDVAQADGTGSPPGGGSTTPPLPGGGSQPLAPAPLVSDPHETNKLWRLGNLLPTMARASVPVGTTFEFSLNEPAAVTLTFTQPTSGRRVRHKCVAVSHKNRRKPHCAMIATIGVLTFSGHAGLNKISFEGKLSRRRSLAPGKYSVQIVARSAAGKLSNAATLSFTVVK